MKTERIFSRLASVAILLIFISLNLSAITVTWVGGNGHWHQPNKWNTGQVPTASDDVIITSGFARVDFPNATARTLTVESGAIFLVTTNGELVFQNLSNVTPITNEGLMGQFGLIRIDGVSNSSSGHGIYNTGDYYVLTGGKLVFQDNEMAPLFNHYNANFNNYGTIVSDLSTSGSNYALINGGDFENRQSGVIQIKGSNRGITNNSGQYTRFRNRGKIIIEDADFVGFRNETTSSGDVNLRNYGTGSISLNNCQFRMGNAWNAGVITVSKFVPPYSFAALNSGTNTENEGIINLYNNKKGIFINNFGSFENSGSINMYGGLENSIYSTSSSSPFVNTEDGYIYVESKMQGSDLSNDGIIISKSVIPHTTVITNNGIIEDYHGALPSSTINNKVIIRPIQGPLINGSQTTNFLNKASLSGIAIGNWKDAVFGGNVSGSYNGSSNIFTPNFHGHGEADLYADMQITGTNNSALVNISISNAWNSVAQDNEFEQVVFREVDEAHSHVHCYPNPTHGPVTINWKSLKENPKRILVLDALGKTIVERTLGENQFEIKLDLNEFNTTGMHLYQLISDQEILSVGKLIKVE